MPRRVECREGSNPPQLARFAMARNQRGVRTGTRPRREGSNWQDCDDKCMRNLSQSREMPVQRAVNFSMVASVFAFRSFAASSGLANRLCLRQAQPILDKMQSRCGCRGLLVPARMGPAHRGQAGERKVDGWATCSPPAKSDCGWTRRVELTRRKRAIGVP